MCKRNATASWSGYSHQGMVGFLVALRQMRELTAANGNRNEFANHFIIYESFEDIAIYTLHNGAKQFLSVHQVKAYYSNGHRFNYYNEVFTGKRIYEKYPNGRNKKNAAGKKIPTANFEPGQWCPAQNYLHTAVAVVDWPAVSPRTGDNLYSIDLYPYTTATFHCGTNEISPLILEELASPDFHNGDQGAATRALNRFCFDLDEKIRLEHATKDGKANYEIVFDFEYLYNRIMDNQDVATSQIFISRKLFYKIYEEIIQNEDIEDELIDDLEFDIINPITTLCDNDFLFFLKRLNINETAEDLNLPHYNFNPEGLRQVFFRALIDIKQAQAGLKDNAVHYCKNGNSNYVLTSIISAENRKQLVVKNIINNLDAQDLLWERHSLINENIDVEFSKGVPAIKNVANENENKEDKRKFMRYSASKLVKRTDATNILNDL